VTQAPLKLADDGIFIVAAKLDHDDELLIEVVCDCGLDRYIDLAEITALRDHLNGLLESVG
jgi:hypothetical protein